MDLDEQRAEVRDLMLRRFDRRALRGFGGSLLLAPSNTVLPAITGTTGFGDTLTCSTGTWSGVPAPTYTYQWQRGGVNIGGQTAATHVIVAADLGATLTCEVTATNAVGSAMAESVGTAVPSLDAQILAQVAAAPGSWTARFIGLSRGVSDFNLSGSAVVDWYDWSGLGNHATQATSTKRSAYSATAANGLPGMMFDGGDVLVTPAIATGAASAGVVIALFQDASAGTMFPVVWGAYGVDMLAIALNIVAGGDLSARNVIASTSLFARSAASYPMTTPAVVTSTWDSAQANESEIRHASVNVTSSASGAGAGTTLGTQALHIGGRDAAPNTPFTGALCALVCASGTGPIPLTQVAAIEALLAAQQGL